MPDEVGHPPTGWTDEDYDGFVADTFTIRPTLAEESCMQDDMVTYIAYVVSLEWDLWDGFIAHPEAPEPYVEMQLDDEVVAAVRRYLDKQ